MFVKCHVMFLGDRLLCGLYTEGSRCNYSRRR